MKISKWHNYKSLALAAVILFAFASLMSGCNGFEAKW